MDKLNAMVENAKNQFGIKLQKLVDEHGFEKEHYARYLIMQYHLTKDVQRPFLMAAANPKMLHYKTLRRFLIKFAFEEEPHYGIAANDLKSLDYDTGKSPLDVQLWWAYFNTKIIDHPFIRLGATCILENLGSGASAIVKKLFNESSFINPGNTKFIIIHMHEALPHGDQILAALAAENLDEDDLHDLYEGTKIGFVLYNRLIDWVFEGDKALNQIDNINLELTQ